MNSMFSRWLPAIAFATPARKAALTVTGLAFAAGTIAGPTLTALAPAFAEPGTPTAVTSTGATVAQVQTDSAPTTTDAAPTGTAEAPAGTDVAPQDSQPVTDKPAAEKLIPNGTQGAQSSISLTNEQTTNAKSIVKTARKLGLGERGAVIGVATALQESKLENLGHLGAINDHDSLGLFQQRPSTGWGTPDQITDPDYSATAFFNGLERVKGWQNLPLTDAAQRVQVSAYPFAYAQWEKQAADVVSSVWNDAGPAPAQ